MNIIINEELKSLLPPLSQEEYKTLEQNIIDYGCRNPLLTWNNILVDGHNRYEICTKHNISFNTDIIDSDSIDDVKIWVIDNQKGRRNLTDGWKFELAQTRKEILLKKGKENQGTRTDLLSTIDKKLETHNTRQDVAESLGWSTGKVAMADKVWKQAKPEIKEAIKSGDVTINEAYKEIIRDEKRTEQQQRFIELEQKELLPTTEKYDVIVIDPAWEMEKIKRDVAPTQVGFDYPTMTIDEIKQFQLPSEKDCHVFMWITHKHLPFGFEIFNSWGVKYVLTFVWHKNGGFQPFGLPQYNCEFVLYGKIGTPEFCDLKSFNVCFNADRQGHSVKPDEFYETIRRVTKGKKIDIFNRRKIEGFDTYGNEAQ
jgi:N6-adenosine-specific RNA methylase IME4